MATVSLVKQYALDPAELVRRWAGVLEDPELHRLPYRIELNKWGHIEMTPPPSPRHMGIASSLVRLLEDRLGGKAFTECAIVTPGGIRIADVVWCSGAFLRAHREELYRRLVGGALIDAGALYRSHVTVEHLR